jgi:hypothetical protein
MTVLVLALGIVSLSACLPTEEPVVSRPEGGPFDPGQNGLPDTLRIESICGTGIVGYLRTLSERYYDVAREWERYEAYAGGVVVDGVTAEEYAGAKQRGENIANSIDAYRVAAEELRVAGGTITGDFVADCDTEVLVLFESLYQERETEISYVASESERTTKRLRKSAGVTGTE